MVFVYYCVMYALWYHVLPLLIFYFIVLHYNVLYGIVLYFLICCTYHYLFKNITQGLSGTLTETIFVYLHICVFVFLCICICMSDNWEHNWCIFVFLYFCSCIYIFAHRILGNIIFEFLVTSPIQNVVDEAVFV